MLCLAKDYYYHELHQYIYPYNSILILIMINQLILILLHSLIYIR